MVCHRPQVSTCRLPSRVLCLSFFLFISLIFMSVFIRLCFLFLFLSPLSSLIFLPLLLPESLTLPKPCKTFHTSTTRPQLTCNVKSTFLWHWSNVSPAFPQPLFNPWLALWARLLGLSLHPAPYCDPSQQFKDKPETPKCPTPFFFHSQISCELMLCVLSYCPRNKFASEGFPCLWMCVSWMHMSSPSLCDACFWK